MKTIRRILFAAALVAGMVCIVLLLNFTAPNPTGRRYSSQIPLTTGQGNSNQIGLDGERILAADLHLPRNDAPDQLVCICNKDAGVDVKNCHSCIVSVQFTAPYRRPDFVARNFIAESKNAQNLFYDSRDLAQIKDYVVAAKTLNRPLWVFTRVNTDIDPEFVRIVATTGGGVVPYFSVPGYVDPVDHAAQDGLNVSVLAILLTGLWEFGSRASVVTQPTTPNPSNDPLQPSKDAVDHAEKFLKDSKDNLRQKID